MYYQKDIAPFLVKSFDFTSYKNNGNVLRVVIKILGTKTPVSEKPNNRLMLVSNFICGKKKYRFIKNQEV